MTIRANSDSRFYYRFIFIGLAVIGMALWFLYDGAVTYPKQFDRAEKYEELQKAGKIEEWPTLAHENGWPTDRPKGKVDAQIQFIFSGLCGFLGLWSLAVVWLARGRWIEGTNKGITSSWGQSFEFVNVVALDKKQWRKKGIAKIIYTDGDRRRMFVLDDYKFDREPTGKILKNLEGRLSPDQITGGAPEGADEEHVQYDEQGEAAPRTG